MIHIPCSLACFPAVGFGYRNCLGKSLENGEPMKSLVRLLVALLPLFLLGCGGDKPRPADTPKQLMEPPKIRPIPGGGNKPPATSRLLRPDADVLWRAA